jgi:Ca2+-binding RTX toxin-like protein
MKGYDRLRTIITQSNLLFLTFFGLSLLQALDASHLLISTTRNGVLRLAGRPRAHGGAHTLTGSLSGESFDDLC